MVVAVITGQAAALEPSCAQDICLCKHRPNKEHLNLGMLIFPCRRKLFEFLLDIMAGDSDLYTALCVWSFSSPSMVQEKMPKDSVPARPKTHNFNPLHHETFAPPIYDASTAPLAANGDELNPIGPLSRQFWEPCCSATTCGVKSLNGRYLLAGWRGSLPCRESRESTQIHKYGATTRIHCLS